MGTAAGYDGAVAAGRRAISHPTELVWLIRQATLSPSGHNIQPWRFRVGERQIDIMADLSRRTPVVDPDDHHLFVSLGCAADTLAIAAAAHGKPGLLVEDPGSSSIGPTFEDRPAVPSDMVDAIGRRQSTRAVHDDSPVLPAILDELPRAAATSGVEVVLLTDRTSMGRVRDLVLAGNSTQISDPAFVRELKAWMRFNPRAAADTGHGLFSAASGQPILPCRAGPGRAGLGRAGPVLFDQFVSARSENAAYAAQLASSSGIAVFVVECDDCGNGCARAALVSASRSKRPCSA